MEININTDVNNDILNHKKVFEEMDEVVPRVRNLIQERWDIIKAQMGSNMGLGEEQAIDGKPAFYQGANDIALEYTLGFWADFSWTISLMRDEVLKKESEELYELQRVLNESNNNADTSESQKKINNDKLAEINNRLNALTNTIKNDRYFEWHDDNWRNFMLEQTGSEEHQPVETQTGSYMDGRFSDPDGNKYKL